jgi:hypothetical protein
VQNATVHMANTFVCANDASSSGDGLELVDSQLMFLNSTAAHNQEAIRTSANSAVTLTNSILWHSGTSLSGPGNATIRYSDVEGCPDGEGMICIDPWFVDADRGNYHLQPRSPAVDRGTNAGAPAQDVDGDVRPFKGLRSTFLDRTCELHSTFQGDRLGRQRRRTRPGKHLLDWIEAVLNLPPLGLAELLQVAGCQWNRCQA